MSNNIIIGLYVIVMFIIIYFFHCNDNDNDKEKFVAVQKKAKRTRDIITQPTGKYADGTFVSPCDITEETINYTDCEDKWTGWTQPVDGKISRSYILPNADGPGTGSILPTSDPISDKSPPPGKVCKLATTQVCNVTVTDSPCISNYVVNDINMNLVAYSGSNYYNSGIKIAELKGKFLNDINFQKEVLLWIDNNKASIYVKYPKTPTFDILKDFYLCTQDGDISISNPTLYLNKSTASNYQFSSYARFIYTPIKTRTTTYTPGNEFTKQEDCPPTKTETVNCNVVNCEVSGWNKVNGVATPIIKTPASDGGTVCPGPINYTECSISPTWSSWVTL